VTKKEKSIALISELEARKSELIELEALSNPSNNTRMYLGQPLSEKDKSTGATPSDIGEVVGAIVIEIVKYADYLREAPYTITTGVGSNLRGNTVAIKEKFASYSGTEETFNISSILRDLSNADILERKLHSLTFYSSPTLSEEVTSDNIPLNTVLIRINSRLNILETYSSGYGYPLMVELDSSAINLDDYFIIGIKIDRSLSTTERYAVDFSYKAKVTYVDGEETTFSSTIANIRTGSNIMDVSSQSEERIICADFIGPRGLPLTIQTSNNSTISFQIGRGTLSPGGRYADNYIERISLLRDMDISSLKISVWEDCLKDKMLYDFKYTISQKEPSPIVDRAIFSNLIPIGVRLEDIINEF